MADADFWRDLAAKFRTLPNDRGMFRLDWSVAVGMPGIQWRPFANEDTRVQFETVAKRAGFALDPQSRDFLFTWLAVLKECSASKELNRFMRLNVDEDGPQIEIINGTIPDPCMASAVQCNLLEALELQKKRGKTLLLPNDTRILLSQEALARIDRAHIEAEKFIWEAEASIDVRSLDHHGMTATMERNKGRLQKARFILPPFTLSIAASACRTMNIESV